jgi:hypothetical protein
MSATFDYGLAGLIFSVPFIFMVGLYAFSRNFGKIIALISF